MIVARRFPFWSTLWRAHASLAANPGAALRAAAPWFVLAMAAIAALSWLYYPLNASWSNAPLNEFSFASWTNTAFELGQDTIGLIFGVVVAVKWHRFLLLGEQPRLTALGSPSILARYLLIAALALFAILLPVYAATHGVDALSKYMIGKILNDLPKLPPADGSAPQAQLDKQPGADADPAQPTAAPQPETIPDAKGTNAATATDDGEHATAQDGAAEDQPSPIGMFFMDWASFALGSTALIVASLAGVALLSYVPMRISLALPAVAKGERETPLARAWALSRGNFWRLFWGSIMTLTLPLIVTLILALTLGALGLDGDDRIAFVALNTIAGAFVFAAALIWVSFLSHAYRALTSHGEQ